MGRPIQNDRIARFTALIDNEAGTLDELGQRLAEGESLQDICAALDVPRGRMLAWLMDDAERYAIYERALELAAHALVAETVQIADGDGFPQNKRIRIETRFKVAQHHAPEKYGRREEMSPSSLVLIANLDRVADALLARLSPPDVGRIIEQDSEGEI